MNVGEFGILIFVQNSRTNSQDENGSGGVSESDGRSNPMLQTQLSIPVAKWSVERTLEWLGKKFPSQYDLYKDSFVQNNVNGEVLVDFNYTCLDHLNIYDYNFRYFDIKQAM